MIIRIRDYKGPVVAVTCGKCHNDNLKPFGGPALNFCSHCGVQFPRMFNNPLQQPRCEVCGIRVTPEDMQHGLCSYCKNTIPYSSTAATNKV